MLPRLLLLVLVLILPLRAARAEGPPCPLDTLDWMLGHWSLEDEKSTTLEIWQKSGEHSFTGVGQTMNTASGEITFHEDMTLEEKDGGIFYTVRASQNEAPVAFRLTACADRDAVFENPDHDFPSRLHYQLTDGRLRADVRGPDGRGFTLLFGRDEVKEPD